MAAPEMCDTETGEPAIQDTNLAQDKALIRATDPLAPLQLAAKPATKYRQNVQDASPYVRADADQLCGLFDSGLPDSGLAGVEVSEALDHGAGPGLVGNTGSRIFGLGNRGIAPHWRGCRLADIGVGPECGDPPNRTACSNC